MMLCSVFLRMEFFMKHKNIAYISRSALMNNYKIIRRLTDEGARAAGRVPPRVICVVKADAYGHEIGITASALGDAGCDFFAVSSEEEAVELRRIEELNSRHPDILILGRVDPENAVEMLEYDIACAAVSYENACDLMRAVKSFNELNGSSKRLRIHVKLDTGMNRVGFRADEAGTEKTVNQIKELASCPELEIAGIFTHCSSADDELMDGRLVNGYRNGYTALQIERFRRITDCLERQGVDTGLKHVANSAVTLKMPEAYFDAVRAGVIIYGLTPNASVGYGLAPAMRFESTVVHIHEIDPGERVSYGAEFVAEKRMVLATVAAGYADGFERAYSGCMVRINGREYRQVGRICMDQFMVDVTPEAPGDPDVKVGDKVILFGGDDGTSVNELAGRAGTINYEVICKVSKRVPRIEE